MSIKAKLTIGVASLAIIIVLPAYILGYRYTKKSEHKMPDTQKGFALVELFTSEGCSSCPPADELLNTIIKENGNKPVYALAFHVDYWNHLGWKDSFSSADYSTRQREYNIALNTETYTPQIIVNGKYTCIGSEDKQVKTLINNALSEPIKNELIITHTYLDKGSIKAQYTLSGDYKGCTLYAALAEDNIIHSIKRGENAGRLLKHNSVVRRLSKTINISGKGEISIERPEKANLYNCHIILFLQNNSTAGIRAAVQNYKLL